MKLKAQLTWLWQPVRPRMPGARWHSGGGGGASIGVKVPADQAGDRSFTWRARQVPHTWSSEDLEAALNDVGFSGFEVLSPGRGRLPWLFRAQLKADAGQPALAIQVGKITVDVERAVAKRKLVNFESSRLNVAPTAGASSKGGSKGATTAAALTAQSAKPVAGQPAVIMSQAQGSATRGQHGATEWNSWWPTAEISIAAGSLFSGNGGCFCRLSTGILLRVLSRH